MLGVGVHIFEDGVIVAIVEGVFETKGFEGVEVGFFEGRPDGAFERGHMRDGDGVSFGDDGHDGRFALEGAQNLEVEVFVEDIGDGGAESAVEVGAVQGGGFLGEVEVGVEADGVEDEEDAVDVGVLDAGGADDFHLLGEGVFKFAFDKGGYLAELEVGHVWFQTLRVP